jgi:lantibiotic modifying enzyme
VAGLAAAHATYLTSPDSGAVVPSYHMGESGILLLWWRACGSTAVADRLYRSVESNLAHPSNEAFWGTSGTLVSAVHLWAATGVPRWRDLVLASAERLWQTWVFDEAAGCHLWTQDLYGKSVQYFGAGHGLAGNVHALLKAAALLDDARRAELLRRTRHALARLAVHEDGAVNWPPGSYTPRPEAPRLLMQWCHGAPGFVTGLADYPVGQDADVEALLLGAGEAIWRAGPLAKGYGLCHGTAGNGQALLLLHQRSGDARWLDRARQFAMAALVQRAVALAAHDGLSRACLWTGDPGLALYLWQCIQARAGMPGLDWLA